MRHENLPTKSSAGWADRLKRQLSQPQPEKTAKREEDPERSSTRIFKHRPLQDYTIVANSIAQSETLSLGAKGLMLYFLSLPDTWDIVMPNVQKAVGVGRTALRTLFRELETHGHMSLTPARRLKDGTLIGNRWHVYADPSENPTPEVIRPPVGRKASVYKGNIDKGNIQKEEKERVSPTSLRSEVLTMEGEPIKSSNPQNNSEPPKAEQKKDKTRVSVPLPPRPRQIPDREEFDAYIAESCPTVEELNPDIYNEYLKNNWHIWSKRSKTWEAIFNWRKALDGREDRLERNRTNS